MYSKVAAIRGYNRFQGERKENTKKAQGSFCEEKSCLVDNVKAFPQPGGKITIRKIELED